MRSPSAIGSSLVVTSLIVLAVPLISLALHIADDLLPSSISNSFDFLLTFPQTVASFLVMYLGVCLHCIGLKFLEECAQGEQ